MLHIMAIEIKELIIKTTIINRPVDKDDDGEFDKQLMKEEILSECRKLVQNLLRERRER
jgi:hypothetical protein